MESQQTVKLQTIVSTKKKYVIWRENFGRIAGCIQKIVLLTASAVTAFPFLWMVLSALKTKEEVMDVNVFFRQIRSGRILRKSFSILRLRAT